VAANGVRWFAKRTTAGKLVAVYKTFWSNGAMRFEKYWNFKEAAWLPTSDVTFSLLVWDNDVEEVEYSEIESELPEAAKPKNPWANY